MSDREQKLIDLCFEMVLLVTDPKYSDHFSQMEPEERAEWVGSQLRECGFPTVPAGSSWGVLRKEAEQRLIALRDRANK